MDDNSATVRSSNNDWEQYVVGEKAADGVVDQVRRKEKQTDKGERIEKRIHKIRE